MWPYDYISSTKYLYQGIISAGFFGKKTIMDGYKVTFKDEGLRHQTTDWLGYYTAIYIYIYICIYIYIYIVEHI